MIYLLPSKRGNRKKFLPFFVVFIFICLIFLINFISPTFLGGVSNSLGLPIWKSGGFFFTQISNMKAFTHSRLTLLDINQSLKEDLAEANAKLSAMSVLEQENIDLKKTFGRTDGVMSILASVLVKPPQSFYDTLILDVGERDNVKNGARVVVGENVVLGNIDEVYEKTSRAKLFSSVDAETLAVINRNNIGVTLVGKGGGNFEIKVPQEVDIVEGDVLILPGMSTSIVSTVVAIEANPTNSFKRIFCKTPINIAELRFVSVAK